MTTRTSAIHIPSLQANDAASQLDEDQVQFHLRQRLGLPTRDAIAKQQTEPEEFWDNFPV